MLKNVKVVKGVGNKMVQDVYRAVSTEDGKNIIFNHVEMINICFVKHDNCDQVFAFENPTDTRLVEGTKIKVETQYGETKATVVSSIKLQKKYLSDFMYAFCGRRINHLRKVIGVYTETCTMFEGQR